VGRGEANCGGRERGLTGAGIFCWSFQSDFTNEMDGGRETDRVKIAIHGNFTLGIRPFHK